MQNSDKSSTSRYEYFYDPEKKSAQDELEKKKPILSSLKCFECDNCFYTRVVCSICYICATGIPPGTAITWRQRRRWLCKLYLIKVSLQKFFRH